MILSLDVSSSAARQKGKPGLIINEADFNPSPAKPKITVPAIMGAVGNFLEDRYEATMSPTDPATGVGDFITRVVPRSLAQNVIGAVEFVPRTAGMLSEGVAKGLDIATSRRGSIAEGWKAAMDPVAETAQGLTEFVGKPFGLYGADAAKEVWLSDPIAPVMVLAPGIPKSLRIVKDSTPYRRLTIKERGLFDAGISQDIQSGALTPEQIRQLWKDPANRESLINKYVRGTEEVTPQETGAPRPAAGAKSPEGITYREGHSEPYPADGATLSNRIRADVVTNKTRQIEGPAAASEPLALPNGQGFELQTGTPYLPAKSTAIRMPYEPIGENGGRILLKPEDFTPAKKPAEPPARVLLSPEDFTEPAPAAIAAQKQTTNLSATPEIVEPGANKSVVVSPVKPETYTITADEAANKTLADNLGVKYNGKMGANGKEIHLFTEPKYGATISLKAGGDLSAKLKETTAKFEAAGNKPIEAKAPAQPVEAPAKKTASRRDDFGVDEAMTGAPIYQAIEDIKASGGLNLDSLKADYGKEQILELVRKRPGIASKKGAAKLDEIAQEYGFTDGDTLLQEILGAKSKKAVAKEVKDSFMEVHGEGYELAKKGFVEKDTRTHAVDLNPGEKVKVKGKSDIFLVKGMDKKGDVILKDGETLKYDAFDEVPVTHIKKAKKEEPAPDVKAAYMEKAKAGTLQSAEIPGASFADTFDLAASPGTLGDKPKPHLKNPTAKMFDERGSMPLSPDSEVVRAILAAKGKIKEAMPHLEDLGRRLYESGKTKFTDWYKGMEKAIGPTWRSFTRHAKGIFARAAKPLQNQKGNVGLDINWQKAQKSGKPPASAWDAGKDIYATNRDMMRKSILQIAKKDSKEILGDIREMADEYLGSISTRLGNIHPELKANLRKFELRRGLQITMKTKRVMPMLEKVKRMSRDDRADFDLARKNGDAPKLKQILDKYKMWNEYTNGTRKVLNELYEEAKAVGLDVGWRKHYHPRLIKDTKGFVEYFYQQESWSLFDDAIRAKEKALGRDLLLDEKAYLINSMLRGFDQAHINLSKPSNLKERQINLVTPELNKFYMNSDAALLRYIESVTDVIEARKSFGITEKGKGIGAADDTIGHYVSRLRDEGKIRPDQEHILRDIYEARFNQRGTRGFVGLYKNVSYIDTMGSPISAITQIGDMAWALYKNGAVETGKALLDAILRKSGIKKEDLGIERIAQEFSDSTKSAKAVSWVFSKTGLSYIDNLGKESLINSTLAEVRRKARDPKKVKALVEELKPVFGEETGALIRDLQAGRVTENVKLHLFSTLADFQPIALSEMPAMYLKSGNGRLFYMLKTFTLKQFDIYRRECFQKIKTPGTRVQGIRNLIRLSACFMAANAAADVIKDLILGRPIDIEDLTEDNIARLFGVSKFAVWTARREGIGTAIGKQILPPFKAADSIYKDIMSAGDGKGLETVQSVPLFGKLYYWWFGKGSQKKK